MEYAHSIRVDCLGRAALLLWPFAGIIYSDSGVTLPPPLPSGFHLSPFISLQVPCYFSDDTQNHFPRVDAATAVAAGVGVKWKSVEMTQPAR